MSVEIICRTEPDDIRVRKVRNAKLLRINFGEDVELILDRKQFRALREATDRFSDW